MVARHHRKASMASLQQILETKDTIESHLSRKRENEPTPASIVFDEL